MWAGLEEGGFWIYDLVMALCLASVHSFSMPFPSPGLSFPELN